MLITSRQNKYLSKQNYHFRHRRHLHLRCLKYEQTLVQLVILSIQKTIQSQYHNYQLQIPKTNKSHLRELELEPEAKYI